MGSDESATGQSGIYAVESRGREPAASPLLHRSPTATAQWHALTGFRSVAKAGHDSPLNPLATKIAEISELEHFSYV